MDGVWKHNLAGVSEAFLAYYKVLLGTTHAHRSSVVQEIIQVGPFYTNQKKAVLNAPYTPEEVKVAMFSTPGIKAPRPDGFGFYFYRDTWHIIGDEIIIVVLDVLQNHIVVTLIPKTKCPRNVSDFRSILCFNTLYKFITKVMCGRLRQVVPDSILENQGGFVHGILCTISWWYRTL